MKRLGLILISGLAACLPDGTGETTPEGRNPSAIINGTPETGWPAVGALTATMQGYYIGQFCTGTLIAPQWVLTAAHCVTPTPDFPISERMTRFFVGNDARPDRNGNPPTTGVFLPIEKFYPHPQYRATDYEVVNDVALVKLSAPVSSVEPVALNVRAMGSSDVGRTILYVGFGNSDSYDGTANGLKRSGTMRIVSVGRQEYTSLFENQGVCAGDSGGPGLAEVDGRWVVIGVNSTVENPRGGDPCRGYANHMRVDVFASWITSILDMPPPDCRQDPGVCECPEACRSDGSCDHDVCQTWTCEQIYDCVVSCEDQACWDACVNRGTSEGRETFTALVDCLERNCSQATSDEEFQQCAARSCGSQIDACFPGQTGDLTCEEAYDCMVQCDSWDRACLSDCWNRGSMEAQGLLGALFTCFQRQCSGVGDEEAWRQCVRSKCQSEILACMPPDDCDLRGGDCAPGQACAPWLWGHTDCGRSLDAPLGAPCDPEAEGILPCGDGLVCWLGEEGASCRKVCLGNEDCPDRGVCGGNAFEGRSEGVCEDGPSCIDDDGDGACADVDCDDEDATRHPAASEVCGDGIDQDCDGATDEDCEVVDSSDETGEPTGQEDDSGESVRDEDARGGGPEDETVPAGDLPGQPEGHGETGGSLSGGGGCTAKGTGAAGSFWWLLVPLLVLRRRFS